MQHGHNKKLRPTTTFISSIIKKSITNADSAVYPTVCRFHTAESGNACAFGTSCMFLHFAHLDRPSICASTVPKSDEETQDVLKHMAREINTLRDEMGTIRRLLQLNGPKLLQDLDEDEEDDDDALDVVTEDSECDFSDDLSQEERSNIETVRRDERLQRVRKHTQSRKIASTVSPTTRPSTKKRKSRSRKQKQLEHCSPSEILRRNEELLRESMVSLSKHTQPRKFASPASASTAQPSKLKSSKKRKRSSKKAQPADILKCFSRATEPPGQVRTRHHASYSDTEQCASSASMEEVD